MTVPSLRVAMIIQGYLPRLGGAEKQLAALAPLLRERGVAIEVITRRYPGMSAFERIEQVPVHRLSVPGPKTLASFLFTAQALPLLRRLQPDVIHAHELLSPTTTAVAAKRWLDVPVIAKVLRGGELGDIAKLKRKPLGARRLKSFKRHVDGFAVISQEIRQELQAWGVSPSQLFFIPNGVDTQRFKPIAAADKAGRRHDLGLVPGDTAVYSGRLVAEKCVDQVIAVWGQIRETYPQAQLLILGTGPEEERLRQMAGAGVHFRGRVEDVAPYLQAADLFVLPSATEGLSNALLEAMACGLPLIATDVGGAPDLVRHKENGWLIPPRQSERLQQALLSLWADPALRQEMGSQARQTVLAENDLQLTADRLLATYNRLATRRQAIVPVT